jgi:hypothetical protein
MIMKACLFFGFFLLCVGSSHSAEWYEKMDIGPAWSNTFAHAANGQPSTAALKGILIDLGERKAHALYDTETLRWVTAYQGFVKWNGTPWTGSHGGLVMLNNQEPVFLTSSAVGWADVDGSYDDKRAIAGHGNLSQAHGRFLGHSIHGNTVIISSMVHGTTLLQCMKQTAGGMEQQLIFAARPQPLGMLVADELGTWHIEADGTKAKSSGGLEILAKSSNAAVRLSAEGGRLLCSIPTGNDSLSLQIGYQRGGLPVIGEALDLHALSKGGPKRFSEVLQTSGTLGKPDGMSAWAVDQLTIPQTNPWDANMRVCGFDFISDDSLAITTWNGDVWQVSGFSSDITKLQWQRIASGIFEPLGLKVVDGRIYVLGRDGITQLIDRNGDGETDFYQAFNRDVIITKNFHEFAFDLHTDQDGNFYFCKGSPVKGGGRGFDTITPHHGIVAKVSADGSRFEVIATGLRAPGGMSVGPQGQITTGENEGSWQPCCKLNYVMPQDFPAFLGTEPSRHALGHDKPFAEPLCYFPMDVDNSGGSQIWVPQGGGLGLKAGELIHLSYGQSSLYRVLPEKKGEVMQGGVVRLPITLSSSAMRARFHRDGSLFVAGFRGWQTNAANQFGLQRVRHIAGKPSLIPSSLTTTETGIVLGFDVPLDEELANDLTSYSVERWNYVRGPQYGSGHFSVDLPDAAAEKQATQTETKAHRVHDKVDVLSATLREDGKSIAIQLKGMKPSMTLKISYDLETQEGQILIGTLHTTVKKLR